MDYNKSILLLLRESALNRGMNTGLENLAWGLSRRGHDIIVVSGGKPPKKSKPHYGIPVRVHYRFVGEHQCLDERLKSEVDQVLKETKVDLIISRYNSVVQLLGNRKNSTCLPPIIVNEGALYPSFIKRIIRGAIKNGPCIQIKHEWILFQSRKRVSHIIAISEAVAKSMLRNGFFSRKKLSVIHRGIDQKKYFFNRANTADRQSEIFRLLFAGNVIPAKGVDDLVMSLQYLKTTPVQIILCGAADAQYKEKLEGVAGRLGKPKSLVFRGVLGPNELLEEYSSADVFVFPSHNEGLGKALVEAMSCELPVISSDIPALREVVTDGFNGLMCPTKNPHAIAQAILRFAGDPELASKCAKNARITVESKFSCDSELDQWEHLIYRFTEPSAVG